MRSVIFCLVVLISASAFAQSKKELQAKVTSLTSEVTALKAEIEQLKKPKEVSLNTIHERASYSLGVLMGSNVKRQGGDSLVVDALNAAMTDVFLGKPLKIQEQECSMIIQPYMQQAMENKTKIAKAEGVNFLNANKTKPGVVTTASGLQYKKLTEGKGKQPTAEKNVTVHYAGKLIDGLEFDSSIKRGEPASFDVNGVIPGWTEALQLMHEGDKWELYIPSELAYGERGAGGQIPPHSVLIFEVELIKVNN